MRAPREALEDAGRDADESFPEAPVGQYVDPCPPPVLVRLTVISGATQIGVENDDWAAVKKDGADVIIEARTDPNTEEAWSKLVWTGDIGRPVLGRPNQRAYSRGESRLIHVDAELGGVMMSVAIWILWAEVTILTGGTTPTRAVQFGNLADRTEKLGGPLHQERRGPRSRENRCCRHGDAAGSPYPAGPVLAAEKAAALSALMREDGPLFAIVDASRGVRPLQLLRESVDKHRSLYDGVQGEALAHCAPYLVALRRDSGLLERLVNEGWGRRFGIYLSCPRPLPEVRRHFRRFLLVEDDETGDRYYFRFYDPTALRVFLPSCTPRQTIDFFGEVTCFFAEGERGELCRFSPP